jgi:hypothetical protein
MTRRRLDLAALVACAAIAAGCAWVTWWIPAQDAAAFQAEIERARAAGPPPPPEARPGGVDRRMRDR